MEIICNIPSVVVSIIAIVLGIWILCRSFSSENQRHAEKEIIFEEWREYKYSRDIYSDDDVTENTCIEFAKHVTRILEEGKKGVLLFNIFAVFIIIIGGATLIEIINSIIK